MKLEITWEALIEIDDVIEFSCIVGVINYDKIAQQHTILHG